MIKKFFTIIIIQTENYEEKYNNLLQNLKTQRKEVKTNFELLKEEVKKYVIFKDFK